MKKSCKICGKEFEAVANGRYCSDECRAVGRSQAKVKYNQSHSKTHWAKDQLQQCPVCGKQFRPSCPAAKYCSDQCREVAKWAKSRERSKERSLQRPQVIRVCPQCGKEFYLTRQHRIYCSEECREAHWQVYRPQERVCPVCGGLFLAKRRNSRYCSPTCYLEAQGLTSTKPKPAKARKKPKETLYDITRELAISGESYGKRQARLREMRK